MYYEIICAGFGGQGVLTAGMMLVNAGMDQGKNVLFYPSYGAEMRGGTANCSVKISDKRISSPKCKNLDVLLALNGPAIDRFQSSIKSGGLLLVNASLVPEDRSFRDDIRVIRVHANEISQELENPKGANIVMLGALAEATDIFDTDYMEGQINAFFEKKGKINPRNADCYRRGVEIAAEEWGK